MAAAPDMWSVLVAMNPPLSQGTSALRHSVVLSLPLEMFASSRMLWDAPRWCTACRRYESVHKKTRNEIKTSVNDMKCTVICRVHIHTPIVQLSSNKRYRCESYYYQDLDDLSGCK